MDIKRFTPVSEQKEIQCNKGFSMPLRLLGPQASCLLSRRSQARLGGILKKAVTESGQ